jgi:cystinosin
VASATGFSFDFAVLNPLGFLCYTLYAILLRYDSVVRRQYAKRNGGHEPQVSRADVGFASHAMLLSSIGLLQASGPHSVTEMAKVTD